MHSDRPLLDTRRSVRRALAGLPPRADDAPPLVLVALSGGADSLALAAALAEVAAGSGVRAGAVIVDHGLQRGSDDVAARAAAQAGELGLDPVLVRQVRVASAGGPEHAARAARYAAFAEVAVETAAAAILTAHTRSDQAEQVLLGLVRGSGLRSLAGIPPVRQLTPECVLLRPFVVATPEITRETTSRACARLGLTAWHDPHNADPAFARVRARERVLPILETELGPGVAAALARTADLAAEDAAALDALAAAALDRVRVTSSGETVPGAALPGETGPDAAVPGESAPGAATVRLDAAALAALAPAIRNRVIRRAADAGFGAQLSREHTATVAALVSDWRGQGPVFVPGIRVTRAGGELRFSAQIGSPRRGRTDEPGVASPGE
ncbi:tRNA lysidine(34) synthetase TilS [Leucobacter luti]|uniref:tRNA(Ile)-lysidine synthase n=1 Tax=Leucobacter luti TaxID=340320 RepID=A0A4Q7U432_9MICO|nr:tRNA lysidine(34) synthetase TilS [Leucobacter luti]MBL3700678.1 tRNA lysidine(34) synthetase TilS [Leucobacter luti]RZT68481.1 tRNA(Ile)-lysidine synthase [Leucobacter luti]